MIAADILTLVKIINNIRKIIELQIAKIICHLLNILYEQLSAARNYFFNDRIIILCQI
jgi:hypothetical protein